MILIMIGSSQDLNMKHMEEAGMVMKKVFGGDSPLRQGAGKSFWTLLILHRRRRRLAVCFLEKSSGL
jgi:hypothetical protein